MYSKYLFLENPLSCVKVDLTKLEHDFKSHGNDLDPMWSIFKITIAKV